ncbi:unnamed protein product [Chrysoparadoxa australica]
MRLTCVELPHSSSRSILTIILPIVIIWRQDLMRCRPHLLHTVQTCLVANVPPQGPCYLLGILYGADALCTASRMAAPSSLFRCAVKQEEVMFLLFRIPWLKLSFLS